MTTSPSRSTLASSSVQAPPPATPVEAGSSTSSHGSKKRKSDDNDNAAAAAGDNKANTNKKAATARRCRKAPHELLTEAEKKANHIASEQKRRQNIRLGYGQLIEIVPSLNHGNRSESLILQKSIEHIRYLISVKNDLKEQVRDQEMLLGDPSYVEDSSEDDMSYSFR